MNSRRILMALTMALAMSGVSTWLVSRRMTAATTNKIADILYGAPARAIAPGEVLKADDLALVSWPGNHPIDGGFTRSADIMGREALFPLAKGQPILERDLSAPGAGPGLASKIPDGMRAVTLRSDEVVGVAGFLITGSHLDVLVTYHSERAPEPLTATVLQNVVAIAAGHAIEPDPNGKPADVTVVTLLLSPEDVQRAVLASGQGQIHFVLRNGADSTTTSGAPVQLSQLESGSARTAPVVRPLARAAHIAAKTSAPHEIETILSGETAQVQPAAVPAGGAAR